MAFSARLLRLRDAETDSPRPEIERSTALFPRLRRPISRIMRFKRLPAGFVIPAQPIVASRPPSGANWVHEIKHDGYRLIVWRDGSIVRLYSRNAIDLTARFSAIAAAAGRIRSERFTIDGEAVVLGPGGL